MANGMHIGVPLRCEICNTMTNGHGLHGYILCAFCKRKFVNVPKGENMLKCHFCRRKSEITFEYDLQRNNNVSKKCVPVCRHHFDELYTMTYSNIESNYLSVGQKEYISIKRLESQLGVINTIQFK